MDCLVFLSNTPHGLMRHTFINLPILNSNCLKRDLWLNKTFAAIPARKINADFKTMRYFAASV
jgi:hypothetical protein